MSRFTFKSLYRRIFQRNFRGDEASYEHTRLLSRFFFFFVLFA